MSSPKRKLIVYGLLALFGISIVLLIKLIPDLSHYQPIFLIFVLYFLILPGWLLARLLKINFSNFSGCFLIYFSLGFGFYLIINLLAIIFGLTIDQLLWLYSLLIPVLFLITFLIDYKKDPFEEEEQESPEWRQLFKKENLIFLVPIFLGLAIFLLVDARGADFNGDPYYHLAIVRKALEGQSMTVANLSYSQSAETNPTYLYPAWQIMTALWAKFTSIDIFNTWSQFNLTLVIIALLAWYFFALSLFKNKLFVVTGLVIAFFFLSYPGPGYFFQRLIVPDSFCQFILMPLALALSLIFIFQKKHQVILPLSLVFIGLLDIHAIHFFYYFLIIISLGILVSLISLFKDKEEIKRTWFLVGLCLIYLVILLGILEFQGRVVTNTFLSFQQASIVPITYATFQHFPLVYKLSFLLLPLTFIFIRNRQLLLLPAAFLIIALIYWTPLKEISMKIFSSIFTDRLLSNLGWYYFIFTLVVAGLFIFIQNMLLKLSSKIILIYEIVLGLGLMLMIYFELSGRVISSFIYNIFFAKPVFESQFTITMPFLVLTLAFSLCFIIWWKFLKEGLPEIEEVSRPFLGLILMVILAFSLFSASFDNFKKNWQNTFFKKKDITSKVYVSEQFGNDWQAIDFIKNQIPPKSTILTDSQASRTLAMLVDQHMVYNQGSAWAVKFNKIFQGKLSPEDSKEIIIDPKYKIDYIFVHDPQSVGGKYFDLDPLTYKKIYQGNVIIYQNNP